MKYIVDHDYHIHTHLSSCSRNPGQTTEALLKYAETNGYKKICVTDHLWDDTAVPCTNDWYRPQNFAHISQSLPLPKSDKVKFCFGAEVEFDKYFRVALSPENMEKLDFIVITTTHLHMPGLTVEAGISDEVRAQVWFDRLAALFQQKLPWHKVGIAHPTSPLISGGYNANYIDILKKVNPDSMRTLFGIMAERGAGFEINFDPDFVRDDGEREFLIGIYHMAKTEGCKFYIGSDAHSPANLENAKHNRQRAVDILGLTEDDKFDFE